MSYFVPRPDLVGPAATASQRQQQQQDPQVNHPQYRLPPPAQGNYYPPNKDNRTESTTRPSASSQQGGWRSKQTMLLLAAVVVLLVVVIVVVVLLVTGGSDNDNRNDGPGEITLPPLTARPTAAPLRLRFDVVDMGMRLQGAPRFSSASLDAFETTLAAYYASIYADQAQRRRRLQLSDLTDFSTTVAVTDQQVDQEGNVLTYDQFVTFSLPAGQTASSSQVQAMLSAPFATQSGREEFWSQLLKADASYAVVTRVDQPIMPALPDDVTPTRAPTVTPLVLPPLVNQTLIPTLAPSMAPPNVTTTDAPTAAPALIANITSITLDDANARYIVNYTTNFNPQIDGGPDSHHVHFYFDTVGILNAGTPGQGPWILYDQPSPFTGYAVADRPPAATQLCITPATNDHAVVDTSIFDCHVLPTPVTNAPSRAPTPSPTSAPVGSPTSRPSLRPTRGPTLNPTVTPVTDAPTSMPTFRPTTEPPSAVPPGVLTATITGITLQNGAYQVSYVSNFNPVIGGGPDAHHLHFYFDTVGVENAGSPGSGPWRLYDVPSPFTQYRPGDRPAGATQMCVTPATNDHRVDNPAFFHCVDLP